MLMRWILYMAGFLLIALGLIPYLAQTRLVRMANVEPDYHEAPLVRHRISQHAPLETVQEKLNFLKDVVQDNRVQTLVSIDSSTPMSARFAYAYVVGGCDPDQPVYRNFLYNIMINSYTLKEASSSADVVVFVQMAAKSADSKLPSADELMLQQMGIETQYLPKQDISKESLEGLMMEKFRIVSLNQYDRVMYLDSDILLRGSLDYLFELSMNRTLGSNVVFASEHEPAAGTYFMLSPAPDDWDRIQALRSKLEAQRSERNSDATSWENDVPEGDEYELIHGRTGTGWDFRGADADSGLLYYWVRYDKRDVSTILSSSVKRWPEGSELDLLELLPGSELGDCWKGTHGSNSCIAPHKDMAHFPGSTKPWLHPVPHNLVDTKETATPLHFWFQRLGVVSKMLSLNVDLTNWDASQQPLLGLTAETEMAGTVYNEPNNIASPYSHNSTSTHRFAYAYVIGGCKPEDPSYRNYLNDIMVSTYVQREEGSKADVIVFIQMAFESEFDELSEEDMRLLNTMAIQVRYIPKAKDESFYRIMLDKFRVLGLIDYDRVIFMDGDVMAVGNLDYIFELSVAGVLKENLVFAGTTEPANGGFFMLSPKIDAEDRIHEIINGKEARGARIPYPHWDTTVGWGHEIEQDDYWQLLNRRQKKTEWDFYGAFADQGLLFHWVKYEQKSVSIVFRKEVEHWGEDNEGKPVLEATSDLSVFGHRVERKCWVGTMKLKPCQAPHSDFVHFTGKRKPWLAGPPDDLSPETRMATADHFWFQTLSVLNDKMQIGLDFKNWRKGHRPFLGMFPLHKDAATTTYKSA